MAARRQRDHWSSTLVFVLAAAGSAVGLGNVWKFPYITGRHGGGAFLVVYLLCVLLIGVPILLAEIVVGRKTQRNPVGAFTMLRPGSPWVALGWLGVAAGFIILSYYSVVAGWVLDYVVLSLRDSFSGRAAEEIQGIFSSLVQSPARQMLWHGAFLSITVWIVAGGVHAGIERGNKVMMPLLAILLLGLVGYAAGTHGAERAYSFLLSPRWNELSGEAVLAALGQAFFSLSLGMGAMITYGSYLDRDANIVGASWTIALADTLIAILAGLMVFPIVFTFDLEPTEGPGLLFQTLAVAFSRLPAGWLIATVFFLLLTFAALTSAISLLEVVVAYFVDERGWPRRRASLVVGTLIFLLGLPSAASTAFLEFMDSVASNYILPVGGLGTAVFVGWVLTHGERHAEVHRHDLQQAVFAGWTFLLRYVCPVAVVVIFLQATGLLRAVQWVLALLPLGAGPTPG